MITLYMSCFLHYLQEKSKQGKAYVIKRSNNKKANEKLTKRNETHRST